MSTASLHDRYIYPDTSFTVRPPQAISATARQWRQPCTPQLAAAARQRLLCPGVPLLVLTSHRRPAPRSPRGRPRAPHANATSSATQVGGTSTCRRNRPPRTSSLKLRAPHAGHPPGRSATPLVLPGWCAPHACPMPRPCGCSGRRPARARISMRGSRVGPTSCQRHMARGAGRGRCPR